MNSNVIPFNPQPPKPQPQPACSFCQRPKSKVSRMIIGETHNICDECLAQATKRLEETA